MSIICSIRGENRECPSEIRKYTRFELNCGHCRSRMLDKKVDQAVFDTALADCFSHFLRKIDDIAFALRCHCYGFCQHEYIPEEYLHRVTKSFPVADRYGCAELLQEIANRYTPVSYTHLRAH